MVAKGHKAPAWKKAPAVDGGFSFAQKTTINQDSDEILAELEREVRQQTLQEFPEPAEFNALWATLVDSAIHFNPARVKNQEIFDTLLRIRATALFAKYQKMFTHQADVADLNFDKTLGGLHKKFADPSELEYFPKAMSPIDFAHLISAMRDPDTDILNPFRHSTPLSTQTLGKEHLDQPELTTTPDIFSRHTIGGPGSR